MNNHFTAEKISPSPALLFLDTALRITALSAEAEELLGMPAKNVQGMPLADLLHDTNDNALLQRLHKLSTDPTACSHLETPLHLHLQNNLPCSVCVIPAPPNYTQEGNETASTGAYQYLLIIWPDMPSHFGRQIADTLFEGVLIGDAALRIVAMNWTAERLTGWSGPEAVGKSIETLFPALLQNGAAQPDLQGMYGLCQPTKIVLLPKKKGGHATLSVRSSSLQNRTGQVLGTVFCFHDCTDSLYIRQVMSSVTDAVFSINTDSVITSFNRAAEKLTGWKAEEVLGRKCRDVMRSSLCDTQCLAQRSSRLDGEVVTQTHFIKHKNKTSIPVSASSEPLYDDLGNIIGNIAVLRDRTTSLRARLILDSIADGVFTVDKNWTITSFNQAAEQITGWRQEEAIGKSCADIFHSSICGSSCAIAEALYTGEPVANRAITIKNHVGKKVPISISASPLIDNDGAIIGGVETFRDLSTITALRTQLHQRYTFDAIVSKSAAMQRLFAILPDIARSTSTVLISGESGTGKELVARALHTSSERSDKPFIVVNCAALPETLLESELFGYKAGAFTDAKKDRIGRFAAAEGGTIFLDEIGELSGSVQAKLLRVLQEKIYEPLGSNNSIYADVRIISATNRNLHTLVQGGSFRDDLFYRLNVVNITLPPLRKRKEDITLLAEHFINKFNAEQGKDIVGLASTTLNLLMRYNYPGNIRELENIIEFAFILCPGGYIQPQHLPEPFSDQAPAHHTGAAPVSQGQTLAEIEKQAILLSLARNHGQRNITSQELGISRDTLRRKIAAYGLHDHGKKDKKQDKQTPRGVESKNKAQKK